MAKRIPYLAFLYCLVTSNIMASQMIDALKKLDAFAQQQIKEQKAVEFAIAVVENNKIIFIKPYGVWKKGEKRKIDLDTTFQLGSTSKPITATLVAILQKQGLINFNILVLFLKPKSELSSCIMVKIHSRGEQV